MRNTGSGVAGLAAPFLCLQGRGLRFVVTSQPVRTVFTWRSDRQAQPGVMVRRLALALCCLAAAGSAVAQPQTYRLSDSERDAILAAAEAREKPAVPAAIAESTPAGSSVLTRSLYPEFGGAVDGVDADGPLPGDRRPHGEISTFIGSGGAMGLGGSAVVPLGDSGMAAFSFATGRGPRLTGPYGGLGGGFSSFGFGYRSR